MIIAAYDQAVARFARGWDTALGPRIAIAAIGLLVVLFVIRSLIRRDTSLLVGTLWALAGAVLLVFAAFPQDVIGVIIDTPYLVRARLLMGGISVLVLLITFESIRRTHLQERYALLWVWTALVILLCTVFPDTVAVFRAITGMDYAAAIVAVAFTFLVLVAFHFSISLSASQSKQTKLAQRVAILEARVRELEKGSGANKSADPSADRKSRAS